MHKPFHKAINFIANAILKSMTLLTPYIKNRANIPELPAEQLSLLPTGLVEGGPEILLPEFAVVAAQAVLEATVIHDGQKVVCLP